MISSKLLRNCQGKFVDFQPMLHIAEAAPHVQLFEVRHRLLRKVHYSTKTQQTSATSPTPNENRKSYLRNTAILDGKFDELSAVKFT